MNGVDSSTKKSFTFTLSLLAISLFLTIGTAYSLWGLSFNQSTTNLVKAGCFEVTLGESDTISLTNTYPMSDARAMSLEPYKLTVNNTCTIDAEFSAIMNVLTASTLDSSFIKYSVSESTTNYNSGALPLKDDSRAYTLDAGDTNLSVLESYKIFHSYVKAGDSKTYNVNLWIKEEATNEIFNQSFKGNILVKSNATKVSGKITLDDELTNIDSGLISVNEASTDQISTSKSYRYVGASPLNYVDFNNETWRIVGMFFVDTGIDVSTNPDYVNNLYERRLKIVKDDAITNIAWDSAAGNSYIDSSLSTYLNGDYYNSINETYRNMIAASMIHLGSSTPTTLSANDLYNSERVEGNALVANVGLLYASDYGYSTGTDCFDTDLGTSNACSSWLSGNVMWLNNNNGTSSYYLNGNQITTDVATAAKNIKPAVYLKDGVELVCDSSRGVCGSSTNHYTLRG
ncbi:MAG: hypothetical protein IJ574_00795 [Bacilli bacterium]|nr:hypothetical protein [Bacilli bacterium]